MRVFGVSAGLHFGGIDFEKYFFGESSRRLERFKEVQRFNE